MCTRGLTPADVLEGCGSTLVVLDAPVNATATVEGSLITGSDVTLRCAASSTSKPRDHQLPMMYRWFEAGNGNGNPTEWTEVILPTKENISSRVFHRDVVGDAGDVEGSGEADPDVVVNKGGHSGGGSLSDLLMVTALSRSDEGRRFSCSASEGRDMWSSRSSPFVLRPEWKPSASDLTLNPPGHSMTLTSGESARVTCTAHCRPDCSVVWKKVTSDQHSMTVGAEGRLELRQVGPQHQGLYRCLADNDHGSAFVTLSLSVRDPPTPWYRDKGYVIMVVAIPTAVLSLGMVGVAVVVYRWRKRTQPFVWTHSRVTQDAVPLSAIENRYAET
ncbi:uncharacterized protein LOC143277608 isoform X2 [Babylonia areolata]|uniref:uncharacterized protein LOC143277608 isoform X2 n=1 Tax=Babylonia areolata TaxID=304850 RepID=UPI003FD1D1F1